jgi:DNA-binding IclR family transcriptional regulator
VTDEELEPGLVAVAAPVFRDGAEVVGALSVTAPASRLTPARIPAVAGQCVAQALGLSAALGHRPSPDLAAETAREPRTARA